MFPLISDFVSNALQKFQQVSNTDLSIGGKKVFMHPTRFRLGLTTTAAKRLPVLSAGLNRRLGN
jgi:hypothetical protein